MKYLFIALSILLTACGGGGSGSGGSGGTNPPQIPAFTVSFSETPNTVQELDNFVVSFSTTGAQNNIVSTLVASNQSQSGLVQITQENNNWNVSSIDLDRDYQISFTLTVSDGNSTSRSSVRNFNVTFINQSFQPTLANVEVIKSKQARLIDLTEENNLINSLNSVSDLINLDYGQNLNANQLFQSSTVSKSELEAKFNTLNLSGYKSGLISDVTLQAQYTDLINSLNTYAAPLKQQITNAFSTLQKDNFRIPNFSDFIINSELDSVSLFYGLGEVGSVQNGKWIFNSDFEYLEELLNNSCSL